MQIKELNNILYTLFVSVFNNLVQETSVYMF
jgi:hypothetical protein